MSRVINPETAGKERQQLSKAIIIAIREMMAQTAVTEHTRDLAAFIALALLTISRAIDPSLEAWEKRGYWLKADRFRMEWAWAERLGTAMKDAVLTDDWPAVASTAVQISAKLSSVKVAQNPRIGTPWQGAWEKLQRGDYNKGS